MEEVKIMEKKPSKKAKPRRKKTDQDVYYPVPFECNPVANRSISCKQSVVRRIVQGSVKAAYRLKDPKQWDYHGNYITPKAVATDEQVEMVMHLIESLQPADAIEVALASQFAISYIRAMEKEDYAGALDVNIEMFEFGHRVLETLQKYKSKGAQQISVQYNVNQGQVVNIKNSKCNKEPLTQEGDE